VRVSRSALALGIATLILLSAISAHAQQDADVDPDDGSVDAAQVVDLTASDFYFDPKVITVHPGPVSFVVHNQGVLEHNFAIETAPSEYLGVLSTIPVKGTAEMDVTLDSGTYVFSCTLPAHREAGMVGVLSVSP
jgi:uncharacterized cupredoxin-like copper-binding protein